VAAGSGQRRFKHFFSLLYDKPHKKTTSHPPSSIIYQSSVHRASTAPAALNTARAKNLLQRNPTMSLPLKKRPLVAAEAPKASCDALSLSPLKTVPSARSAFQESKGLPQKKRDRDEAAEVSVSSDDFPKILMSLKIPSTCNAFQDSVGTLGFPQEKRRREVSAEVSSDDDFDEKRFRSYQTGQWAEKYNELCHYRQQKGHCLVPHTYQDNLALARWVKRQRYQYNLTQEGKASTMTDERILALENIGFVWDSQGAAWCERFNELKTFRRVFVHCNVPSNYQNKRLATWVKCQRRQFKLHKESKPSNITLERIQVLENLGFEWGLRNYKKSSRS
jgi:hypothetical protein